jgi:hypothetical protein
MYAISIFTVQTPSILLQKPDEEKSLIVNFFPFFRFQKKEFDLYFIISRQQIFIRSLPLLKNETG